MLSTSAACAARTVQSCPTHRTYLSRGRSFQGPSTGAAPRSTVRNLRPMKKRERDGTSSRLPSLATSKHLAHSEAHMANVTDRRELLFEAHGSRRRRLRFQSLAWSHRLFQRLQEPERLLELRRPENRPTPARGAESEAETRSWNAARGDGGLLLPSRSRTRTGGSADPW